MNVLQEIDWIHSTALFNVASFTCVAFDEYSYSKDKRLLPNEVRSLRISASLLGIAAIHYTILSNSDLSPFTNILIRYSDWLLTTPLLLWSCAAYYDLKSSIIQECIFLNVCMILFGFAYETTNHRIFWGISVLFYLILLIRLNSVLPEKDLFIRYFVIGWSSYGLISLLPFPSRIVPYTVMDVYNKLLFALSIRSKIRSDVEKRS